MFVQRWLVHFKPLKSLFQLSLVNIPATNVHAWMTFAIFQNYLRLLDAKQIDHQNTTFIK